MADDHQEAEPAVAPDLPAAHRATVPQSPYTNRQVAVGFLVLAVGVLLTFGLGLALA